MKSVTRLFLISFILIPVQVLAGGPVENFNWLVGIPGLEGTANFEGYINALYALAISVAALIAVVKIIIAGAKYMMSDIVSSKSEAKEDIRNSLIGLLIIIGAVIILNTVNSNLTNVEVDIPDAVVDDTPRTVEDGSFSTTEEMEAAATERNTELVVDTCNGDFFDPLAYIGTTLGELTSWDVTTACAVQCRSIPGIMNYDGFNSCTYLQDDADQCNPQASEFCCWYIKGGEWGGEANTCSGLEEAEVERIAECYESGRTWDEANDTCRTNACNPQTDQECCEITFEGSYTNGSCATAENIITDETVCLAQGAGWAYQNGLCVQQNPGIESQPVVGNVDPYAYCMRLETDGGGWEFNEANNRCER